jgi:hypothetical protein
MNYSNKLIFLALVPLVQLTLCESLHPVSFGIQVGKTYSWATGSELDAFLEYFGSRPSGIEEMTYGMNIHCRIRPWLYVQSGIKIVPKGYEGLMAHHRKVTEESLFTPYEEIDRLYFRRTLSYVEFPLILRPTIAIGHRARLYGLFGGWLGLLSKAVDELYTTHSEGTKYSVRETDRTQMAVFDLLEDQKLSDTAGTTISYAFNDFFSRQDLGLTMGFGLELPVGDFGLYAQSAWNFGMINFNQVSPSARRQLLAFGGSDGILKMLADNPTCYYHDVRLTAGLNVYFSAAGIPRASVPTIHSREQYGMPLRTRTIPVLARGYKE